MLSLKGIPTLETIQKVDKVKKEIIACVYKPWRFLSLSRGSLYFNHLFDVPLDITDSAEEIGEFIYRFTRAPLWGEIAKYLIGYDMAYRLRIQDMLNECNKVDLYIDPHKEMNRLWEVYKRRESVIPTYMLPKSRKVFNLIYYALFIPSVRRRLREAINKTDWRKFEFTDDDKEWIAQRIDYKFYE